MNPYDPPQSKSMPARDTVATKPAKSNIRSLVIPALVGGVMGAILLAPITRGPGDPTGHGIAFGLGGLLSLLAAIVFRAVWRRTHEEHQ